MKDDYPTLLPLSLVLILAILLTAGVGRAAATQGQEDAELERGRREFTEVGCYQCHGYDGQGGAGPRIVPVRPTLEAFSHVVRKPPNVMPAYSPNVLSDDTVERIHKYLLSIPEPPEASSLSQLSWE